MKGRIFIVLYSITLFLVYTTQQVIPVNYPIYQPTYRNIPISIPVSIHQVNNNRCNDVFKDQNPIVNQQNLAPVISENINKILINKVLSNPTLQAIIDPNNRIFNQNLLESSKQLPSYGTTPNIVNNYFIIPPECFKVNKKVAKVSKCSNEKKTQRNVRKDVSKIPQKIIIKTDKGIADLANSNIKTRNEKIEENANTKKKKRDKQNKKLSEEFNTDLDIFKETNANLDPIYTSNRNKNTKSKKRSNRKKLANDDEVAIKRIEGNTNEDETQIVDIQNVISQNGPKPVVQPKLTLEPIEKEIKIKSKKAENRKSEKIRMIDNKSTPAKNTDQDKLMQDFRRQFPNVPDNILNNMMPFMNQYSSPVGFNYPNNMFPFNFDQIYQYPQNSRSNPNRNKNRRVKQKGRKNSNTRRNKQKSGKVAIKSENHQVVPIYEDITSSTEVAKNVPESMPTDSSETFYKDIFEEITTERIDSYKDLNKTKLDNNEKVLVMDYFEINGNGEMISHEDISMMNSFPELNNTMIESIEKKTQREPNLEDKEEELHLPELGNEDIVPTIYENSLIEDYYPIFTDDATYFANNQEYYYKDINDRHFYSTDRSQIPDRRLERFASFRPLALLRDKLYNSIEKEAIKKIETVVPMFKIEPKEKEETVEFRSPPALEFPGFVTRKVTKEDDNAKYVEDKSSIYSNFKTPLYNILVKPDARKVAPPKAIANPGVETVYAQSKVVKYGQSDSKYDTDDNGDSSKDDLSLVMAKSVDYPEEST